MVHIDGRDVCSYVYHEFGSKNRQGGFNSLNSDNKSVRQYENTSGGICHVKILDKYLQKIPDKARSADNFTLLRSLEYLMIQQSLGIPRYQ